MRKVSIVATVAAVALTAALLAGCANTASSTASSAASSGSTTTETAPDSTATADSAAADSNSAGSEAGSEGTGAGAAQTAPASYSADTLKPVLDEFVSYEAGTAGGSLKTAYAAAMLVEYAAQFGPTADPMTVGNDVQAWADALTDEQKACLMANWSTIKSTADSIAADPTAQKELLDTAGYPSDLTTLDLSGVTGILTAVDGKLSAVK